MQNSGIVINNGNCSTLGPKTNRPVRVQLYAGLGSANAHLFAHGLKIESESNLYSPTVGVNVIIPISKSFLFVSPGLSYNQRGIRFVSESLFDGVTTVRTPIHTLSGSLLLGTDFGSQNSGLRLSCGLYGGYTLSGSAIVKHSQGMGRVEELEVDIFNIDKNFPLEDFDFGNLGKRKIQSPIKRFDLGLRASCDFEF